jgi:hypothetical protein
VPGALGFFSWDLRSLVTGTGITQMKNGCGDRDSWCWREEVKLSRWRPEQTCFSEREREREGRREEEREV